MTQKIKRPGGFTIVELLVVVAVIAVLLAMLLPSFQKARYQARVALCTNNLRQIAAATLNYAADSGGFYPGSVDIGQPIRRHSTDSIIGPGSFPGGLTWPGYNALGPYFMKRSNIADGIYWLKNPVFVCPVVAADKEASFQPNSTFYSFFFNTRNGVYDGTWFPIPGSEAIVVNPGDVMRKIGRPLRFKGTVGSPAVTRGYLSRILVSDISQVVPAYGSIEAGHMRGGSVGTGGYSSLRSYSKNSICSPNFAFDDGSVRSTTYNFQNYRNVMVSVIANTGGSWDNWTLPLNELSIYR